jgi:selenocysteine lyase/cysteine desulfurase
MAKATALEAYFDQFRQHIIGVDARIPVPNNEERPLVYADWTASGRNYAPIEEGIRSILMPTLANTHTETNYTGQSTTYAYHKARSLIKKAVGAHADDVLLSCGSGMTGVTNKFQRILGWKIHERFRDEITVDEHQRPVVFITHMEHHSNQTSWLETIAEVVVVPPDAEGRVSPDAFEQHLAKYANRPVKIAAITSCSNVTGLMTPYAEIAQIMHRYNGYCFVDFACSGPYVDINMHPEMPHADLDAIYFSPHKFLGGPGSTGILVFNNKLYANTVPDNPGGGTVDWTNPWGEHKYVDDIEAREDGGTPPFLQTIKAAMCLELKQTMGVDKILAREKEQLEIIWQGLEDLPNLHILAGQHRERLGVISFYIDGLHYLMGVKLLNDKFGIQTRGGCSCAGTYGHYLLNVDIDTSHSITEAISGGNCASKPGWIRMSIHPTLRNAEIRYIVKAIRQLCERFPSWQKEYDIDWASNTISAREPTDEHAIRGQIDNLFQRAKKRPQPPAYTI